MPCNSVNVGGRNDEFVTGKAKFGCGGMTNDGNDQKWGGITKNGGNGWGGMDGCGVRMGSEKEGWMGVGGKDGKGKGPEARKLNQREDILVYWSENG